MLRPPAGWHVHAHQSTTATGLPTHCCAHSVCQGPRLEPGAAVKGLVDVRAVYSAPCLQKHELFVRDRRSRRQRPHQHRAGCGRGRCQTDLRPSGRATAGQGCSVVVDASVAHGSCVKRGAVSRAMGLGRRSQNLCTKIDDGASVRQPAHPGKDAVGRVLQPAAVPRRRPVSRLLSAACQPAEASSNTINTSYCDTFACGEVWRSCCGLLCCSPFRQTAQGPPASAHLEGRGR